MLGRYQWHVKRGKTGTSDPRSPSKTAGRYRRKPEIECGRGTPYNPPKPRDRYVFRCETGHPNYTPELVLAQEKIDLVTDSFAFFSLRFRFHRILGSRGGLRGPDQLDA